MRTVIISLVFSILMAGFCLADDPGARDSIIVETVYSELGDSTVDVKIFATCDDSVGFYILPLIWNSMQDSSSFFLTDVTYHNTLILWDDTVDSLLFDQSMLRMFGIYDICGDDNPPLMTSNYREHCWTLRFSFDPGAQPQVVTIDTTYDLIYGSMLVGIVGGMVEFPPVFVSGAIFYGVTSDITKNDQILPTEIGLAQNYPNPFNASTVIKFELPEESYFELTVYNLLGQKAATIFKGEKPAGYHTVTWDGSEFPSGVYFASLRTAGSSKSVKMLLLK